MAPSLRSRAVAPIRATEAGLNSLSRLRILMFWPHGLPERLGASVKDAQANKFDLAMCFAKKHAHQRERWLSVTPASCATMRFGESALVRTQPLNVPMGWM